MGASLAAADIRQHGKKVQYRRNMAGAKPWLDVADNRKKTKGAKTDRVTIDPSFDNSEFMRRDAAFKTAIAILTGREDELPEEGKWTRKTLAEAYVAAQCDARREQLQRMFDACGPLPDPDDKGELARYVARVFAWDEQNDAKAKK